GRCLDLNIEQLTFRVIAIPNYVEFNSAISQKTKKWIQDNIKADDVIMFLDSMESYLKGIGKIIRVLPYGAILYDYRSLSVTKFDYCVQDGAKEYKIRSLIFQEDGHLYTHWNSLASRIF
ncbi:unnamed protein product, partial [marine sediment metagenome]